MGSLGADEAGEYMTVGRTNKSEERTILVATGAAANGYADDFVLSVSIENDAVLTSIPGCGPCHPRQGHASLPYRADCDGDDSARQWRHRAGEQWRRRLRSCDDAQSDTGELRHRRCGRYCRWSVCRQRRWTVSRRLRHRSQRRRRN